MAAVKELISKEAIKSVNSTAQSTRELIELFDRLTKEAKDANAAIRGSKAGTNGYAKAKGKAAGATKKLTEAEKKLQSAQKQLAASQDKLNKDIQAARLKTQQYNKEVKLQARLQNAAVGSTDKLKASVAILENRMGKLDQTTAKGAKRARAYQSSIDRLNKKIDKQSSHFVRSKRNVGNYQSALSGLPGTMGRVGQSTQMLGSALKFLASPVGLAIGAVVGFGMAIGKIIGTFSDFQKKNAELAAVLGKTRGEIGRMRESAKQLGATTSFTAAEVIGLQTELAKLGFSENEILKVSKSIIDLSVVTGKSASDVAAYTGATIKQFGLTADEADRIADVSAKAFSSSALDFEKLSTSMAIVGPIAKSAGRDVEETTALLGVLSDRGLDASISGTALRNIFLELSKQGMTMNEALDKIRNSTDKNKTAMDLFGKRAAVAGTILAESSDDVARLQLKLDQAGGTASKVANEQLDTLQGKTTLMKSAWDGLLLSIEDGEGVLAKLVMGLVDAATAVLNFLTPTQSLSTQINKVANEFNYQKNKANELLNELESLADKQTLTADESKRQEEVLGELNGKYGEYLPNLLTEKSSLDDIALARMDINEGLRESILLQQKEAMLQQVGTGAVDEQRKAYSKMNRQLERLGITTADRRAEIIKLATQEKMTDEQYNQLTETLNEYGATNDRLGLKVSKFKQGMRDYRMAAREADEQTKELNAEFEVLAGSASKTGEELSAAEKIYREYKNITFDSTAKELESISEFMQRLEDEGLKGSAVFERLSNRVKKLKSEIKTDSNLGGAGAGGGGDAGNKLIKIEDGITPEEIINEADAMLTGMMLAESNKRIEMHKIEADKRINAIKQMAAEGVMTEEEANGKIQEITKETNSAIIDEQIVGVEKELELAGLSFEKKAELEVELARLKQDLQNQNTDNYVENLKREEEKDEEIRQARYDAAKELQEELLNLYMTIQAAKTERELSDLEKQKEAEIAQAEAAGRETTSIEEKYAEKANQIKREQAKKEKAAAIIQATISGALAVLNTFKVDPTGILAAIIGAVVATQIATIAAQPLPEYAEGTQNSAANFIAGEQGQELMITKSGKMILTPDRPTEYHNMRGTTIIPSDQTKLMLAMAARKDPEGFNDNRIVNSLKELKREFRRSRPIVVNKIGSRGDYHQYQNYF